MTPFETIKRLWLFIMYYIYNIFVVTKKLPLPIKKSETEIYLLDKTNYFNEKKIHIQNQSQIEPFFYDKQIYTETMKNPDNPYEKQWKTKILFENTPRGNVIFTYDIYKMGFCYFSDQQAITYDILNAIAMKYVITFRCLDFFIDEKYHTSPFLELYEKEHLKETKTQQRINRQNNTIKNTLKSQNTPLKIKTSKTNKPSKTDAPDSATDTATPPITIKNRFLYQGKITNFSFCQKIQKKRTANKPTIYNELFEKNPQMSYRDFKNSQIQTSNP
jgi:hypothetical protein